MNVTDQGYPTAEDAVVGWMWRLVEPTRPELAHPLSVEWQGETWTVATNGHILAARRGAFGFPAPDKINPARVLDSIPACDPFAIDLPALRALAVPIVPPDLAHCEKCNDTGRETCDECDGDGFVECTCLCGDDHERDCEECGGDGYEACDCGRGVPKADDIRPVAIGVGRFNLALFAKALPCVPGDVGEWRQHGAEKPASLTIGDVLLVIMPLRITDERSQTDVSVALTREPAD